MKRIFIFTAIFSLAVFAFVESSQALRITLKRIIFEGAKRAEVVTIINNSDEEKTYRLGWRHFRMTPDKSLVAVPDDELTPDIKPVVNMVRFAPRRFTIPPNSSQQVRMMLRMPADLPDGEYRSHLWVRPEADIADLRTKAKKENERRGVRGGVSLAMLAGVTMPVIVRKGPLESSLSIVEAQASASGGFVDVSYSLQREGTKSLYGDIDYVCNPGAGSEFFLRTTRGIAVYAEATRRNFNLRIEKPDDRPSCQTLSITYSETQGFDGDKIEVLAQEIVNVN
jgi:hypothetical protein